MTKKRILISSLALIVFSSVFAFCLGAKKLSKPNKSAPAPVNSVASVNQKKISYGDYYFGFNTQMIHGPGWSNNQFLAAAKNLFPENLRYPGGTTANYWDWKKGWFVDSPLLLKQFKTVKPFPITLENFKIGIDATNATPIFVLNVITSDIKYQLEMLHHAKDIGLKVKFIELGNEFFSDKDDAVQAKYPSGKDYALDANKWIVAIKKEFPDARIGVVCSGRDEGSENDNSNVSQRTQNWDSEVLANVKDADAAILHIYTGPGIAGKKKADDAKGKMNRDVHDELKSKFAENVESTLGVPFLKFQQMNDYSNSVVPKGMKTWYTEYNLFEKNMLVSGTWTHGLYVSLMSVLFLNIDKTELICNHNIAKNARFTAIFNDENGYENNFDAKKTTPFGYSAGGACLSLVGMAMNGKNTAQQLDFTNAVALKSLKKTTYPSLFGFKFSGNGKESVIVFNLNSSASSVDMSKVVSGNFQFKTYSGDPVNEIADMKEITSNTGSLKGQLSLPAYSITVIY